MPSTSIEHTVPVAPQTVLVVDDEPTARIALAARLKRMGYRVIEAVDGKSGLDALRRERPDLTILDWMMPEIDGPSFCERVRQDPELLTSQILMMTSHDQPEQIAEGLARGADDFLSKAASKYEITARVQSGIRAATLIRRLEDATEEIRRKAGGARARTPIRGSLCGIDASATGHRLTRCSDGACVSTIYRIGRRPV
jgi:phosphoserine phosphatase RsbU/P